MPPVRGRMLLFASDGGVTREGAIGCSGLRAWRGGLSLSLSLPGPRHGARRMASSVRSSLRSRAMVRLRATVRRARSDHGRIRLIDTSVRRCQLRSAARGVLVSGYLSFSRPRGWPDVGARLCRSGRRVCARTDEAPAARKRRGFGAIVWTSSHDMKLDYQFQGVKLLITKADVLGGRSWH